MNLNAKNLQEKKFEVHLNNWHWIWCKKNNGCSMPITTNTKALLLILALLYSFKLTDFHSQPPNNIGYVCIKYACDKLEHKKNCCLRIIHPDTKYTERCRLYGIIPIQDLWHTERSCDRRVSRANTKLWLITPVCITDNEYTISSFNTNWQTTLFFNIVIVSVIFSGTFVN